MDSLMTLILTALFNDIDSEGNIFNDEHIKKALAQRLECSPMARETWVQSQVESYQRL